MYASILSDIMHTFLYNNIIMIQLSRDIHNFKFNTYLRCHCTISHNNDFVCRHNQLSFKVLKYVFYTQVLQNNGIFIMISYNCCGSRLYTEHHHLGSCQPISIGNLRLVLMVTMVHSFNPRQLVHHSHWTHSYPIATTIKLSTNKFDKRLETLTVVAVSQLQSSSNLTYVAIASLAQPASCVRPGLAAPDYIFIHSLENSFTAVY